MLKTVLAVHLIAFLAPLVPLHAQPSSPDGGVATVDAALADIRDVMRAGKWKDAKEQLRNMLADSENTDALVARWPWIADALARCTFWSVYSIPEPKDVVPEIVSWKERTGDLKLRYKAGDRGLSATADGAGGFIELKQEDDDSFFVHPVRFSGSYRVELSGRDLDTLPVIFVDWLWGSMKGQGFGTYYGTAFGDVTGIWAFEGGEADLVDSATTTLLYGRPYSFEVRVASSSVTVSYNGKRQLKIKRPKGEYGQFGLRDLDSFEEVEIVGEVEPAWIAGLVQDEVLAAWNEFAEDYDPLGEAPAPIRDRVEGEVQELEDFGLACPGDPDDKQSELLDQAKVFYDETRYDDGLKYVKGLGDEVEEVVRDWMLAHFLLPTGDTEAAYDAIERVAKADPDFYNGRLTETWISKARLDDDGALMMHEELLLDFSDRVEPYEALALLHLYAGRLDDAEEVLTVAASNEVPMQALHDVGITLLRQREGPSWPESDRHASKKYVVRSNAGKSPCVRIATELDQALRAYERLLGEIKGKAQPKFPVFFFAGQAGYQAYCQDLLGTPEDNTAGIFHPALKQLLLWDSPNPGMTMRTVRHEGFHQYFDRLVGDSPRWLNEGMAEYYEQAQFSGGHWEDDQINIEHVSLLREVKDAWVPLEKFVRIGARPFYANARLNYAQAWAFVHFLQNGGRQQKKIFKRIIDALKDGMTNDDAVDAGFEGVDFDALEGDFRKYVQKLK